MYKGEAAVIAAMTFIIPRQSPIKIDNLIHFQGPLIYYLVPLKNQPKPPFLTMQ